MLGGPFRVFACQLAGRLSLATNLYRSPRYTERTHSTGSPSRSIEWRESISIGSPTSVPSRPASRGVASEVSIVSSASARCTS